MTDMSLCIYVYIYVYIYTLRFACFPLPWGRGLSAENPRMEGGGGNRLGGYKLGGDIKKLTEPQNTKQSPNESVLDKDPK
jgi:hypothetical protein